MVFIAIKAYTRESLWQVLMIEIRIDSSTQRLHLMRASQITNSYLISTAKNGLGEQLGSEQTPRGWHIVHQKIGANEALGRVFQTRLATDWVYSPKLAKKYPNHDWILTRIIRLAGLEMGFNLGGTQDSLTRCIYIHGAIDKEITGKPTSRGCIRMHNRDIIQLFDKIMVGTPVFIQ